MHQTNKKMTQNSTNHVASLFSASIVHPFSRSLSHQEEAKEASKTYFDHCQEGDTVLANFFIDRNKWTTLEYYKKENGKMILHHMEAPYDEIKIKFTYEATAYAF
jgi:hypothetical protein